MRRAALFVAPIVLVAAACSGAQDPNGSLPSQPCPTAEPHASATPTPANLVPAPASLASAEGTVKTLAGPADVPLVGPRVDGKAGDLMVENGAAAVVVTQEGRIIDFGRKGARDELIWLNPAVSVGINYLDAPVKSVSADAGNKAIRLERMVAGKPLLLVTWVYLKGPHLHLETVAHNTSDDPALAITLGERVSWGNVPTWMDGYGYIKDAKKITGGFLARDSMGVAYAMCSENGPIYAKFDEQEFGGLFEPARTGESVVLVPAHGQSPARSVIIGSATSVGEAVMSLPCGPKGPNGGSKKLAIAPILDVPRARLEVNRCDETGKLGKPFLEFRSTPVPSDAKGKPTVKFDSVELPLGCFRARLTAPGHTPGAWVDPESLKDPKPEAYPQAGKLAFSVTEAGKPVPARLVVRGDGNTMDPDWGDDAENSGAAANVFAAENGSGEAPLPPGKYRVLISRGFEYTAHEEKIEIKLGKLSSIKASLDRVVDTKGWVAADLHLHAVPSGDAPSLLSDRIRSLVASGIEAAVATDHNAITDYRPTIAELGVGDRIMSLIGDEITTRDVPWGHFNAFPFTPDTKPIIYKGTVPSALFAEVRASKPLGKDTILQVNHPRMGNIGYFEILRFDPTDIPAWLKRSPLASLEFDALEVFNGDHYTKIPKVEECLKDWYALLNAGYRSTATGNSDSHRVSFHEPGVPRNLVLVPDDDPKKLDERTLVDAIRAGRVVVSSGPFVTLKARDKTVGDTIPEGETEIVVTVDGPPWVDIDEVMLLKRGESLKAWKVEKAQGKRPWQFKTTDTLKKGDWVIALARGKKPMTFLYRSGAIPFGFTNPIFVK